MSQPIDEVISDLDEIIKNSISKGSPAGYFPALYRRVTETVGHYIASGKFEDNARMEAFDVIFAQRYLDAYRDYESGKGVTRSWQTAFEEEQNNSLIALQHLLLGMNAHISLDLGIAAAAVVNRSDPMSLKNDFFSINEILESMINDTQTRLTRFFGPLGIIDQLLGSVDDSLSMFSIRYARDKAWTQFLELMLAGPGQHEALIQARDIRVAGFSRHLVHPPSMKIRILLRLVRLLEKGSISGRIKILQESH